jgi:hypothetical protein
MANLWFKFYGGEYMSDAKIGRMDAAERSCWLTLLCLASMSDTGTIKYLSVDDLLTKSGIKWDPYNSGDWEKCQNVLVKFSQMKMIKVSTDESSIEIVNWAKRQEKIAQTPYERVKKYRENKAKLENDNEMITDDNADDNNRIEENRKEKNIKEIIYSDDFLKFYNLYPRKIGKMGAYKKWETTIKKVDPEKIIKGLQDQLDAKMFSDDQKFIKHPEVWLNKGCWDDTIIKKENKEIKIIKKY